MSKEDAETNVVEGEKTAQQAMGLHSVRKLEDIEKKLHQVLVATRKANQESHEEDDDPSTKEVTCTFKPTSFKMLGIECDEKGKVTKVLEGGQAKDEDVKVGSKILRVDGAAWESQTFQKTVDGTSEYQLAFEVAVPEGWGEDPDTENSMSWQKCVLIIVFFAVAADLLYGLANRSCIIEQMGLAWDAWKLYLESGSKVMRTCDSFGGLVSRVGLPESVQSFLRAGCMVVHPSSQTAATMYDKATAHYNIAMNCAGRYASWFGGSFSVSFFVVTITNGHTRRMFQWLIRNPMGLEVN